MCYFFLKIFVFERAIFAVVFSLGIFVSLILFVCAILEFSHLPILGFFTHEQFYFILRVKFFVFLFCMSFLFWRSIIFISNFSFWICNFKHVSICFFNFFLSCSITKLVLWFFFARVTLFLCNFWVFRFLCNFFLH